MKLSHLVLSAALAAGLAPVAQAQTVVQPKAPLDSARASVRDAILVFRDSLQVVHAGGARMRRDFQTASGAALVSRARIMRDGCAASVRALSPTRAAVESGPAGTDKERAARTALLVEMDRLSAALTECRTIFSGWVDSRDGEAVRGYGNRASDTVRGPILTYEDKLQHYLGLLGIRIQPLGAGTPITS